MNWATESSIEPVSKRVMNLSHFVTQAARRFPEKIAFVWGDESWTWREIDQRIDAVACALAETYGVRKGDRVLVQSQNCNQMFESMFACFRIGSGDEGTSVRPAQARQAARSQGEVA